MLQIQSLSKNKNHPNIQMSTSPLNPSIKTKIDKLLTPLIDNIHKNKIYSYHQLKYSEKDKLASIFENQNLDKIKTSLNYSCLDKIHPNLINLNICTKSARTLPQLQLTHHRVRQFASNNPTPRKQIKQLKNIQSQTKYNINKLLNIKNDFIDMLDYRQIQKRLTKKKNLTSQYLLFKKNPKKQLNSTTTNPKNQITSNILKIKRSLSNNSLFNQLISTIQQNNRYAAKNKFELWKNKKSSSLWKFKGRLHQNQKYQPFNS